jgi:hypothetical protein
MALWSFAPGLPPWVKSRTPNGPAIWEKPASSACARVRLRGTKGREGEGKTGTAVALTVLFGPIGLLKHGKEVKVQEGAPLAAYVDQDINLPAAP